MKRLTLAPRPNWQRLVARQGLPFHTNGDGTPYWDESACFEFTLAEIERLERCANELHGMFLEACRCVVMERRWDALAIPANLRETISRSWRYDDWELYGRFDLALGEDGTPKLLEYNADTPTGLIEASLIQWYWKEDTFPDADQFNSLHEKLFTRWKTLITRGQMRPRHPLHLTAVGGYDEDRLNVGYVGELAEQAGLKTQYIPLKAIGWDPQRQRFVDEDGEVIHQLFKLYPWEWLAAEAFGEHLPGQHWQVVEPAWKALCNCKGRLLVLQTFPRTSQSSSGCDEPKSFFIIRS